MQRITLKCDKCGRIWTKGEKDAPQMWSLGIWIADGACRDSGYGNPVSLQRADWCRQCMVDARLLPPVTLRGDNPPPEEPARTLEDLVRDIVCDELAKES